MHYITFWYCPDSNSGPLGPKSNTLPPCHSLPPPRTSRTWTWTQIWTSLDLTNVWCVLLYSKTCLGTRKIFLLLQKPVSLLYSFLVVAAIQTIYSTISQASMFNDYLSITSFYCYKTVPYALLRCDTGFRITT